MKIEAYVLMLVTGLASCLRRGPHHPHGQTPVDQKHHHYKPQASGAITADEQLLHDTVHLEEDSPQLTPEMLAKMSPAELEFLYFHAHDFDKNSKLDGLEMLKAAYHIMDHELPSPDADKSIEPEAKTEENELDRYIAMVDQTLAEDDTDKDGFVSYTEYRAAREKNPGDRMPHVLMTERK